jgi:tetratricopeptide (TPR) repeat protein
MKAFPKSWLNKQTKSQLIKLLEARCETDSGLLDYLMLKAAVAAPEDNLKKIRNSIRNAFWIEDYVHWDEVYSYTTDLDPVLETLRELLEKGKADTVVGLVEEAFECWAEAANSIHDDGEMGMVLEDLHELHLKACRTAKIDPVELAETLFEIGSSNEWDILTRAYSDYGDLLGETGKRRYRERVTEKWEKLPKVLPGKKDPNRYENRSDWLDRLMIDFMREAGDFAGELSILSRDLSQGWDFLTIARRCAETGRDAEALVWVEKGLKHFNDDAGLRRECAGFYWKVGRREESMEIWWQQFEKLRDLENYKTLVSHAGKIKRQAEWREKALDSIRVYIAAAKGKQEYWWNRMDHSLLVEIFLWEGDEEQAWKEAECGGCSEALWLKLCARREKENPAQVYPIYMRLAEQAAMRKKNDAYREAVKRIKKAKALAKRCEQSGVFDTMLAKIRMQHKPKRNLMKYLTEAGL